MNWKVVLSLFMVTAMLFPSIYILSYGTHIQERRKMNNFMTYRKTTPERPIIMLVNSTIYDDIFPLLKSLENSVANYHLYFIVKNVSGESPEEIRNMLGEEYASQNISGAVLIGKIPLARYQDKDTGETFDFPYYYMELNGVWKDTDGNGIIDTPSGDYFPEIWVGIVRSTNDHGNNITEIESYIHRVIDYLNGKFNPEVKSGVFVDDDFLYLDENIRNSLIYPYLGEDIIDENTNAKEFLNFLSKNYAYDYFIVHSDGSSYFLKTPEGYQKVNSNDLGNTSALFYTDFSCYGASFKKGAIANHLVMNENSNGLGVLTYTGVGYPDAMNFYHIDLGSDMNFGDSLIDQINKSTANTTYFNTHVAMLAYLGFPFLKPWRPHGYKEVKDLEIDGDQELLNYTRRYGWSGDGSEKNPIKISNLMIFSTIGYGSLVLKNISLHVEISHCWILTQLSFGINVVFSRNVSIMGNRLYYSSIYVINSRDIVVENNYLEGSGYYSSLNTLGFIDIVNSSFIKVFGNEIYNGTGIGVYGKRIIVGMNNGVPIFKIYYARHINVSYNRIEGSYGIGFEEVRDSYIYRNDVEFTIGGLGLYLSKHNLVTENNFTLIFTNNTWTFGNTHDYYLSISSSHDNYFYLNNFVYNGTLPKYVIFSELIHIGSLSPSNESTKNYWNNSKYGNYWEWWALNNDTNDQNHDGIVDYPYFLDINNTDYRPLKEPYTGKINETKNVSNVKNNVNSNLIFIIVAVGVVVIVLAVWVYRRWLIP